MAQKSTNLSNLFIILGAAGSIAAVSYFSYKHLTQKRGTTVIELEVTKNMLKQIKHQIMVTCISLIDQTPQAQRASRIMNATVAENLRNALAQLYEQKENAVLTKYDLSKAQLAATLKQYANDQEIKKNQTQILDILECATQMRLPDLTIPEQPKNKFNKKELKRLYIELCKRITCLILQCVKTQKQKHPQINTKDDKQFRNIIKNLNLFKSKVQLFIESGFDPKWGCPNQIFFKLLESHKQTDNVFKIEIKEIEKAYGELIDKISQDPLSLTIQEVNEKFSQFARSKHLEERPIVESQKQQKPINVLSSLKSEQSFYQLGVKNSVKEGQIDKKDQVIDQRKQQKEDQVQLNESAKLQDLIAVSQSKEEDNQKTEEVQLLQEKKQEVAQQKQQQSRKEQNQSKQKLVQPQTVNQNANEQQGKIQSEQQQQNQQNQ